MKVIVAEKPSVAKGIANVVGAHSRQDGYFEGGEYQVTWCFGHLVELFDAEDYDAQLKKWDISDLPILPSPFRTKVRPDAEKQFNIIKSLINNATEVIEATDAGREGELIFRLVYEMAGCTKPIKRLWISSLEPGAIRKGMNDLKDGSMYEDLYAAAKARQEADWMLGINLSRFYTCGYNILLPTGRVQTATVNLVVEREKELQNFVPVLYWILSADLGGFTVTRREDEKKKADRCEVACKGGSAKILKVEKKTENENPKPLYDLTSLQQDMNRLFGLSAQKTLDVLQDLYEKRLTTYPRTDSKYITEEQRDTTINLIKTLTERGFFKEAEPLASWDVGKIINDKKVSDHHGILPTLEVTEDRVNDLSEDEKHVLTMVMWRLLIAVSPTYRYETTHIVADINRYEFETRGKCDIEPGYKNVERTLKKLIGASEKDDKPLPEINVGNIYDVLKFWQEEKKTTPPGRFTEATLLAAMETCGKKLDNPELREAMKDKGLGTPATRANIIESIIKSQYIERQKKCLVPTEKAFKFIELCADILKKPETTGSWEYQLALIQKGELRKPEFMAGITKFLRDFIATEKIDTTKRFSKFKSIGKCPKCGGDFHMGKYGGFCGNKCGMTISKAYGKALTEKQITDLLAGKKILLKGLVSKTKGTTYDAYLTPTGVAPFEYTKKDGTTATGYGLKYQMDFPPKKK